MATIQAKMSRGHKYWYIVESRRVNGKPRPVVLAYLGKAEDLLRKLQELPRGLRSKSYSHGGVAALLSIARTLSIPATINRHVKSPRSYMAGKPIRNGLTVGMTLLLGAIGRVCQQTSKRGWSTWAKTTSCEYLLRSNFSAVDSQHFWDLMDALPIEAIPAIEHTLLQRVIDRFGIQTDTLFFDTTNFYTFIATTNARCTIAQRGKNKQHRADLRQVGLALVVSREDRIPLFHLTYQGNLNDLTVFKSVVGKIKQRMEQLHLHTTNHTIVFDQGNNSRNNLALVQGARLHYVGALSPSQHVALVDEALGNMTECVEVAGTRHFAYRDKRAVWGEQRTVVVFISDKLREGQIRGLRSELDKAQQRMDALRKSLANPRSPRIDTLSKVEEKTRNTLRTRNAQAVFSFSLTPMTGQRWNLTYKRRADKEDDLVQKMGLRIIMTDRHEWSSSDIIRAYHGQAAIETVFRDIKNPCHLPVRPQYHWTDQKITVHFFMCVLGYLLAALVRREAATKAGYRGCMDKLFETLNSIRLTAHVEESSTPGPAKTAWKLETMDQHQQQLLDALGIEDIHTKRPAIDGCSVYTDP